MAAFTALAIIAAVSAGVELYQKHKAAQATRASGALQNQAQQSVGKLYDWNASIAELQADDAIARGNADADRFRSSVNGLIGKQRAGIAAGNIDVNYGSPVDVVADTATQGEKDILTIKNNAAREAWGFRVTAQDTREKARIARREGTFLQLQANQQATQLQLQGVSSVLGSGSTIIANRYGWR